MAQLIIAAAGAAIGGAIAGPGAILFGMTGAQLGWLGGSVLGSMIAGRQKTSGPRLDEMRVSGTEYGGGIAWVAGAPRLSGDLIWASDRREIATTEEVGKGGGSEYTSYTYEIDALYLLADQPGAIVTRCWDNGKLIWTSLASADDLSRIASEQTTKWRRITIYGGDDDQLPDPTYDAAVTNAPGYTRRLTVLIEGLQLGNSGALPNLTFEVVSAADTSADFVRRYEVADTGVRFADNSGVGVGHPGILSLQPEVRVTIQSDSSTAVWRYSLQGALLGTTTQGSGEGYPSLNGSAGGTVPINWAVGMMDGLPVRCANHNIAIGSDIHLHCGAKSAGAWNAGILPNLATVLPSGRYMGDTMPCADGVHLLVLTGATNTYFGGTADQWHIIRRDNSGLPVLVSSGTVETPRLLKVFGNCSQKDWTFRCGILEDDLLHVWITTGAEDGSLEMLKIGLDGVMRRRSIMSGALLQFGFTYPSIWAEGGFCVVVSRESFQAFRRAGDIISVVPLRTVVEGLCDRATMPAGTYDASALASLTIPVRALAVTNGSARQALEILQTSHGFDAFVTDKLYFVPRGGASVLTVDPDDLAAGDGDAAGEPFALTVNADLEIPGRVAVVYRNMDADQVNGTETSERGPTGQDSIQTMQLALGMAPAEARGVADAMVRDAFASRLTSQISLPLFYTKLTPTDVVQIPDSDGTLYRMRITRRSDSGGILSLDVVGDDSAVVVESAPTSADYSGQSVIREISESTLLPLDIPLLRDADDGPSYYVAARGQATKWAGCKVYSSANAVDYTLTAQISSAAVLGVCTTTLGAWTGGAVMDEINSVTVDMQSGELASTTRDSLLSTLQVNTLIVGNEVIRFVTATLLSANPNVYKLTRLLRGQLGTEWACSGHVAAERAVLLRTRGMARVELQASDIGHAYSLKAVSNGKGATGAAAVAFTPAGVALKPWAPANLRAAPGDGGTINLSWDRRSRLGVIRDARGTTIRLGEAVEAYEVDVYDAGPTLVQTLATSTPSALIGGPEKLLQYAYGIDWPGEWSGKLYGCDYLWSSVPPRLRAFSADGALLGSSATFAGRISQVVYNGSGVAYVLTLETNTTGTSITAIRIYAVDLATMTAGASIELFVSLGAVVYQMTHDGTDLWTIDRNAATLRRHNPSTLAVTGTWALTNSGTRSMSIATDGAGTFFLGNRDFTKITAFVPGSSSTTWSIDFADSFGSADQLLYVGGALLIGGEGFIGAVNPATGAIISNTGDRSYGRLVNYGASNAAYIRLVTTVSPGSTTYTPGPVCVLNASGTIIQTFLLEPDAIALVGTVAGDALVASRSSSNAEATVGHQYGAAASLVGGSARVYQMSATVGRGYAATISL